MTSKLEQLKRYTTVVADTGDLDAIARLQPVDATTNPSLLLKAATYPRYARMMAQYSKIFLATRKQPVSSLRLKLAERFYL